MQMHLDEIQLTTSLQRSHGDLDIHMMDRAGWHKTDKRSATGSPKRPRWQAHHHCCHSARS